MKKPKSVLEIKEYLKQIAIPVKNQEEVNTASAIFEAFGFKRTSNNRKYLIGVVRTQRGPRNNYFAVYVGHDTGFEKSTIKEVLSLINELGGLDNEN